MAKRLAAHQDRAGENLGTAWDELAEYVAYELNKEGLEGTVLAYLAPYPKSAFDVAWNEFGSEDSHLQCIGAVFPAYVPTMYDKTLAWMWGELCERRRASREDAMIGLICNSVAERLVITAVHWLQHKDRRKAGIAVLKDMIIRTTKGTFWNDSHFAAAALLNAKVAGARGLAQQLASSKPGKEQFASFLKALLQGDESTLHAADALADTSRYQRFKLPAKRKKQCEALVKACKAWEPFSTLDAQ